MAKYVVYGIMTASMKLGEYEADSEEAATEMANSDPSADWMPSLCHHWERLTAENAELKIVTNYQRIHYEQTAASTSGTSTFNG